MRETLCQYLECPVCRSGLKLSAGESDGGEILDGDFTEGSKVAVDVNVSGDALEFSIA